VLRVHGGPQDARLDAVPAYVRVRWVCVRGHGGLQGLPDLPGREHRLLRDLHVRARASGSLPLEARALPL